MLKSAKVKQMTTMPVMSTLNAYHDRMRASFGVRPYPILLRKGQKMTNSSARMTCIQALHLRHA